MGCSRAMILCAAIPFVLCGQVDSDGLLKRARTRIIENVEQLPKHTCVRTVRRSRFEAFSGKRVSGCAHAEETSTGEGRPRLMLAWTEVRFGLEDRSQKTAGQIGGFERR